MRRQKKKMFEPCESKIYPGLSMYDVERSPRTLKDNNNTKNKEVTIRLENISPQITCPICLNVMRHTVFVKECCHRFCSECIQKCLRVGRKECPACRTHVPSRRSLRPDKAFDALIEKCLLQTDVETYVRKETMIVKRMNEQDEFHKEFAESVRVGMEIQERNRKRHRFVRKDNNSSTTSKTTNDGRDELMEFVLIRHPEEKILNRLRKSKIAASSKFTAKHMKRLIEIRTASPKGTAITITIPIIDSNGKPREVEIEDDWSLSRIRKIRCGVDWKVLVLFYRGINQAKYYDE